MDLLKHFQIIEQKSIKYPYLLFNPYDIPTTSLLVWCHGSYDKETSLLDQANYIKDHDLIYSVVKLAYARKMTILVPILPRARHSLFRLDSQIMHRHVMGYKNLGSELELYSKPDVEVTKMISLTKDNIPSIEKTIIGGFSAGGNFSNRYTCLHPEHIDACIVMSAGDYMFPLESLSGENLIYPFGMSEMEINKKILDIPHLIYTGEKDDDNSMSPFNFDLSGTGLEQTYLSVVGETPKDRASKYFEICKGHFKSITFLSNSRLGHSADTDDFGKVFSFIDNIIG